MSKYKVQSNYVPVERKYVYACACVCVPVCMHVFVCDFSEEGGGVCH